MRPTKSFGRGIPSVLPFCKSDLRLPVIRRQGHRNSISGVQSKVLLSLEKGVFSVVESGGDYILKPVPEGSLARFASDIPANELVTMQIAAQLFGIRTADCACVSLRTANSLISRGGLTARRPSGSSGGSLSTCRTQRRDAWRSV